MSPHTSRPNSASAHTTIITLLTITLVKDCALLGNENVPKTVVISIFYTEEAGSSFLRNDYSQVWNCRVSWSRLLQPEFKLSLKSKFSPVAIPGSRGEGGTLEQGIMLNKLNILPSVDSVYRYFCTSRVLPLLSGPGSVVGIVTGYGLDGKGIESRWGEIFRTCPDRP